MTDPATLTVATITALAASKFVGKAAEKKAAEVVVAPAALERSGKQVEKLWGAIKGFFQKQKHEKAEAALAKVEAGDAAASMKLEAHLPGNSTAVLPSLLPSLFG